MKRSLLVLGILLVSSLVVAPADSKAVILPDEGVIYFANNLIADMTVSGTSVTAKRFGATDVAPDAAASKKAYHSVANIALSFETAFEWKATQEFTIDGPVTAHFWMSCDVATVYRGVGAATYRFTFQKNGATVGTAASVTDASAQTCTGPTSIREMSAVVTAPKTTWKVGDTIAASIGVWALNPPEAAAKNLHFLVGSTAHPSHIRAVGIPLVGGAAPDETSGPAAEIAYQNETLNGTSAKIDEEFANATNAVHNYTWVTQGSEFVISASGDIENGSVGVEFFDGAGKRVHNVTLTSANNTSGEEFTPPVLVNATAGNWTIRAEFKDFVGKLSVTVGVAPNQSAPASTSNETAAPKTESEGGIPGASIGLVAAGVFAIAVALRRRRQGL